MQLFQTALSASEYELESLRHQYLTINAPTFEIPARIRVSNPGQDNLMTSSRTVTDVMDLAQSQGVGPRFTRIFVLITWILF